MWSFNMAQLHFRKVLWQTQLQHQNACILHQRALRLLALGRSPAVLIGNVAGVNDEAEEKYKTPSTPPQLQQHYPVNTVDPLPPPLQQIDPTPTKALAEPPPPPSSLLQLHPPRKSRVSVAPPDDESSDDDGDINQPPRLICLDDLPDLIHDPPTLSTTDALDWLQALLQRQHVTRACVWHQPKSPAGCEIYGLRGLTDAQTIGLTVNYNRPIIHALTRLRESLQKQRVTRLQFWHNRSCVPARFVLRGLTNTDREDDVEDTV